MDVDRRSKPNGRKDNFLYPGNKEEKDIQISWTGAEAVLIADKVDSGSD